MIMDIKWNDTVHVPDLLSIATNNSDAIDKTYTHSTSFNLRIVYLCIGFLGLLGNLFIIFVIFSSRVMRLHRTNIYIVNQSFIDAMVALSLILTTIFENDGRHFNQDSLTDVLLCKLWLNKIWLWSFMVSSTYNLMALTFERYLAINHPLLHKVKITRPKLIVSMIFVWLVGPLYNGAYMIPSSVVKEDGNCTVYSEYPSDNIRNGVGVITIFVQFVIPLTFLIVCYSLIARNLRRRITPTAPGESGSLHNIMSSNRSHNDLHNKNISKALRNIIRTLFIVASCFTFCWIWNQVYYLMFHLRSSLAMDFSSNFYHFTVVMVFCNCCVNPFVYIAQYHAFQRATRNLFFKTKHNLWGSNTSDNTPV